MLCRVRVGNDLDWQSILSYSSAREVSMFGRCACAGLGGTALILSVLGCALDDRSLSRSSELTGGFGNGPSGSGGDGGSAPLAPLPTDCDYSKEARPECQSL